MHPFAPSTCDRAIGSYGVMFFAGPAAAFGNVGRALRPGGRLAFLCPVPAGLNCWGEAVAPLRGVLTTAGSVGTTLTQVRAYAPDRGLRRKSSTA
ncbi:class I SAM-dependent methyltransferase [Streptomyces sp. NPDC058330]|uniref:class I SAM-dependent methyltransferase n=1 Tax=Streptomyces sp. NPDC058330 TaxID=3346449 RepID=UPI0036EB894D